MLACGFLMPRCPNCNRIIHRPFAIRNLNYAICQICATTYLSVDCVSFDIVRQDMQMAQLFAVRTESLLLGTHHFRQFLYQYRHYTLEQLLKKRIITMLYQPLRECDQIVLQYQSEETPKESPTLFQDFGKKVQQLSCNLKGKMEDIRQDVQQFVSKPQLRLHYQIGKFKVQNKIKELAQEAQEAYDNCRQKITSWSDKFKELSKSSELIENIKNKSIGSLKQLKSWFG